MLLLHLYCILQDHKEGICVCVENQQACGSDNKTYENICALNEAAIEDKHLPTLVVQHWGPCYMGKMTFHKLNIYISLLSSNKH